MANHVAAAALQYSKWLSRFICWVWAIYRFGVLIASVIEPSAAEALASTLINLDWIMLVNEGTYLINSLGEKYIYSDRYILRWLDKGGFKTLMSKIALKNYPKDKDNTSSDDDTDEDHSDEMDVETNIESDEGEG